MDSNRFQVTTHGRAALAACLARGAPVAITRVEVGSGRVADGANLAEQHELVQRVADGTIGERRHEDDRLFLTVQYENVRHPEIPTFFLSEFLIFIQDPETGGETDFLYASLGEYIQPVPAYREGVPATTLQYPVVLTLSGDLEVTVSAPVGLVTHIDLAEAIERAIGTLAADIIAGEVTTPLTTHDGEPITTHDGEVILARRRLFTPEDAQRQSAALRAEIRQAVDASAASLSASTARTAVTLRTEIRQAVDSSAETLAAQTDAKISAHKASDESHPKFIMIH